MTMSETETYAPALGPSGEQCAHCGAVLAADQRYCINCGLRRAGPRVPYEQLLREDGADLALPETAAGVAPPPAPVPVPAADTRTISPLGAAVAIGLLLLAVLLGAVIGRGGDPATPAPVVVGAAAAGAATAFTTDWTGEDGWTIELQALPKASTQPAQVAAAKAAAEAKGAADVGALDSDTFVSLPGGTYILYSGTYGSRADAQAALAGLKASFPDATVVQVSTTSAAGGGASTSDSGSSSSSSGDGSKSSSSSDGGSTPAATGKSTPSPSTQDFVKKSKKLPDKVGTGGAPPATDDKAPGGGSEGTTIG